MLKMFIDPFFSPLLNPHLMVRCHSPASSHPCVDRPGEERAEYGGEERAEYGGVFAAEELEEEPLLKLGSRRGNKYNFNFHNSIAGAVPGFTPTQLERVDIGSSSSGGMPCSDDVVGGFDDSFFDEDDGEGWHEVVVATPAPASGSPSTRTVQYTDALTAQQFVKQIDAFDEDVLTRVAVVHDKPADNIGAGTWATPSSPWAACPDGMDDVSNCSEPSVITTTAGSGGVGGVRNGGGIDSIRCSSRNSAHVNSGNLDRSGSVFEELDISLLLLDDTRDACRISPIESAAPTIGNGNCSNSSNDDSVLSLIFQVGQTSTSTPTLDDGSPEKENNVDADGAWTPTVKQALCTRTQHPPTWRNRRQKSAQRLTKISKRGSQLRNVSHPSRSVHVLHFCTVRCSAWTCATLCKRAQ